jgi:hypothetical protein
MHESQASVSATGADRHAARSVSSSAAGWLRTEVTREPGSRSAMLVRQERLSPSGSAIELLISVIVFVLRYGTPGRRAGLLTAQTVTRRV